MNRFDGLTVVVAGGGNQLGQACAQHFGRDGAHVVVIDSDDAEVEATCALITDAGGTATPIVAAVDDLDALRAAAARSVEFGDRVDVLVNAQNVLHWTSIEDSSVAQWDEALRTNLLGPILSTKAFLGLLKKAAHGAIVHIGSVDGTLGNARVPTYSVTKGGLVPLTHVMADELAAFGIRVNCVARAAVAADPPTAAIAAQISRTIEATPLRRAAQPDEVAAAVAFLAGADASYMTGTVLVVDGGRSGLTPGCSL